MAYYIWIIDAGDTTLRIAPAGKEVLYLSEKSETVDKLSVNDKILFFLTSPTNGIGIGATVIQSNNNAITLTKEFEVSSVLKFNDLPIEVKPLFRPNVQIIPISEDSYSSIVNDLLSQQIIGKNSNISQKNTSQKITDGFQTIYYGAPGTGKSHEVKCMTGEINIQNLPNVFRTTFHPDTDYATFVGCYKPTMRELHNSLESQIAYSFVPQVFTEAYIYAYQNPKEKTYLVIEEINRGNCAQIFGDLFQLLDRKENGTSEYSIKADTDLANYLESQGLEGKKLCLPSNFYILATMNTSDQSLFPMDSAFKRRWDWKYVPISYTESKSSAFTIDIDGKKYSWVEFIKAVNKRIFDITQSEDKEMGNFFIKSSINTEQFKSKVMFYLWNEVLRDEVENNKYFFYSENKDGQSEKFTFKQLYEDGSEQLLIGFMNKLELVEEEQ